jgi:hypothetical protein
MIAYTAIGFWDAATALMAYILKTANCVMTVCIAKNAMARSIASIVRTPKKAYCVLNVKM